MVTIPRYRSQGFALAAVLWLMAGLSIVVVLVADAAKTSAERVAQLRERTEFIQSALSGRAQAEYWLSGARPRTADFFDGAAGCAFIKHGKYIVSCCLAPGRGVIVDGTKLRYSK